MRELHDELPMPAAATESEAKKFCCGLCAGQLECNLAKCLIIFIIGFIALFGGVILAKELGKK